MYVTPLQLEVILSKEGNGSTSDQASEEPNRRESLKGGIRQGIEMLTALKNAIEESLNEARERGDLTPERAREIIRATLDRAQARAGEAKDAFDLVNQKEFEALRTVVEDLKVRLICVERLVGIDTDDASTSPDETSALTDDTKEAE